MFVSYRFIMCNRISVFRETVIFCKLNSVSILSRLYQHIDYKPASLQEGEAQEYLLALKQELRGKMKYLPYYTGGDHQKESMVH